MRWIATVVVFAAIFGTVGCKRSGTAKRDSAEEHRMLAREIYPPRPRIPSGSGSDSIGLLPWR